MDIISMLILNGQSSLSFLITAEPVQCSAVRGILVFSTTGSNKQTLTLNIYLTTQHYYHIHLESWFKVEEEDWRTHKSLSRISGCQYQAGRRCQGQSEDEECRPKYLFCLKVGISSKLKMQSQDKSQASLMILFLSLNLVYSMFKCGTSKVLIPTFGSFYSTGAI